MFSAGPKTPGSQPLRPRTRDACVNITPHRVGVPTLRGRRTPRGVLLTSVAQRGGRSSSGSGGMLSWTAHLKGGAPVNIYHAAVAVGPDVYSFGGFRNGKFSPTWTTMQNEVHVFNAVSLRWRQLPPGNQRPPAAPSIHEGYTAVLIGATAYVWGGCSNVAGEWRRHSALYAFDVDRHRWSRPGVSGSIPEARGNHSACAVGTAMYVYGGATRWAGQTNSMYALDTAAMVWSLIGAAGTPPPASSLHSSSAVGATVFVFGGLGDEGECYGQVRAFDTKSRRWLKTTTTPAAGTRRPEGRFGHSAFTHDGELYVFGGSNWNRYFADLWRFSPATSSWTEVRPKGDDVVGPSQSLSQGHWMCCCTVWDDHVVLFNKDDLYVLDFRPSLKTLCKLAVVRHSLKQSGLPHNVRWEMAAMTTQQRTKKSGRPAKLGINGGNRRR